MKYKVKVTIAGASGQFITMEEESEIAASQRSNYIVANGVTFDIGPKKTFIPSHRIHEVTMEPMPEDGGEK